MAKIVTQQAISIPHGHNNYVAKIEVTLGAKILKAKLDRWSLQLSILEDADIKVKEEREIIIAQVGMLIQTHDEKGLLIRVLKHICSIEVANWDELLHIFENIKR